jgi:prephenate dehydrogenase
MKPHFGIVGVGDLGSQLLDIFLKLDNAVNVFDHKKKLPQSTKDLEELSRTSAIIHWCAPLEGLADLPPLCEDQTLILHASVMHESLNAKQILRKSGMATGKIAIVHLLMNEHGRVIVSQDSDDTMLANKHLTDIGLQPVLLTTQEHDHIMAISQAPMAILHELLLAELEGLQQKHLLTPSGEELLTAIHARAAKWTPNTLASILRNPQISQLVAGMTEVVNTSRIKQ